MSDWTRMTLRRVDGQVYMQRWGIPLFGFGVAVHKFDAPDPGLDLHDHPWWFGSLVLWGGYLEERAESRVAPFYARVAARWPGASTCGVPVGHRPWTWHTMRLDECHRITRLSRRTCWTLVIRGRKRRRWGFWMSDGWMDAVEYDRTVRAERRDMLVEL